MSRASSAREFLSSGVAERTIRLQRLSPGTPRNEGEEVTGMIAHQSGGAVVLRGTRGAEVQVPRSHIQQLTRSTTSVMPEGLEQGMREPEFRDPLAFLQGLVSRSRIGWAFVAPQLASGEAR